MLRIVLLTAILIAASSPAEPRLGADLSFVPQLEALGAGYRVDGQAGDALDHFRDAGHDIVRLRLWHSPAEPWHGTESTLDYALRAAAAGHELMLDFHYSDSWADPGKQDKPAAWEGLGFEALADSVQTYTREVIARFAAAGATPRYVQIGNEIGGGLLWDEGRVGWPGGPWDTPQQWLQLGRLLAAAAAGVREALPPGADTGIIVHVAEGGNNARCRWFFDGLLGQGLDFDILGLSFYPWWHGRLPDLAFNLHDLAARYGRPVFVVECSYPWILENADDGDNFVWEQAQLHGGYEATPEGQLNWLRDLRGIVRYGNGGGGALLGWEPAWLPLQGEPGNPSENLALFDFQGDALPGLRFAEAPAGSRYASIQALGDFNDWSLDAPAMTQVAPGVWEDTLSVEAGCHLMKFVTDGAWDLPLDFGSYAGESGDCDAPLAGELCLVEGPGTALGQLPFPATGDYLFRFDEAGWSYRIVPLR